MFSELARNIRIALISCQRSRTRLVVMVAIVCNLTRLRAAFVGVRLAGTDGIE